MQYGSLLLLAFVIILLLSAFCICRAFKALRSSGPPYRSLQLLMRQGRHSRAALVRQSTDDEQRVARCSPPGHGRVHKKVTSL